MNNLWTGFEQSAASRPDAAAFVIEDREFPYGALVQSARRLAARLQELAPGDSESERNIGLFAPSIPGFATGFYGILAADKVAVPINFLLNPKEIMTIGMHAGIRILIAAGPLYEKAEEMAASLPVTILRAEDFMTPDPAPELPEIHRGDDDTAVLMYTSGTTGTPKGVDLSHNNILSNCHGTKNAYPFSPEHTFVCVLPYFHSFGLTAMMILPNLIGSRVVLIPQFQPQKVAEVFSKYPKCIFFAVSPMYQVLTTLARTKGIRFPNLELCVSGAAALPMDVRNGFLEATGIDVYQGYGLTEASPVVSFNLPGKHKPGTIGLPLSNIEVQIWDEEGNRVPTGEVGELMVKGPNVMKGYYKNPEATEATISSDGWLHTGDLARVDEEGYMTIAGRKKELIICAGENIYPLEIEDVLISHPAVAESAVVGIPHKQKGEDPKAFVTLVPGASVDVGELRQLCRDRLAAFKVPAEIEIREELPKGPTGKILKRVLEAGTAADG